MVDGGITFLGVIESLISPAYIIFLIALIYYIGMQRRKIHKEKNYYGFWKCIADGLNFFRDTLFIPLLVGIMLPIELYAHEAKWWGEPDVLGPMLFVFQLIFVAFFTYITYPRNLDVIKHRFVHGSGQKISAIILINFFNLINVFTAIQLFFIEENTILAVASLFLFFIFLETSVALREAYP